MDCYNTKIIDFGNGNKQVITYKNAIKIDKNKKRKNKNIDFELSENEIEKKYLHSMFTSCNRSKNELYKIARCNQWDYFATFTFNRNVVERTDYEKLLKKITKWFNNIKNRKCPDLKYCLVPEQHKKVESNGLRAWHFHALLSNCDGLTFDILENLSYAKKTNKTVYSLREYKLGYNTLTKVENNDACTRYLSKYITKELTALTKGKRRYIASQNCDKPKEYLFMDYGYQDLEDFTCAEHDIHLEDMIDMEKCVWKKEKVVDTQDFQNTYTYYEFKNEFTPIFENSVIKKCNDNDW